ncbi:protein-glutamate methylesterase/protein-glutamine glutaminase [Marinicrinis lubricantis]|uniref:Protein-glutamate methylesterase/protein-glutamine glutaminase n=1 Tax=Marinicrinis lubricantis TaxID=2086470 RepID=A0ABW1IMH4_9BACL
MKRYKIMVVDDSAFMRKMISDMISSDPLFEVVCKAKNGQEAVELVKVHSPDAITMDVHMPLMDGLEALRQIMKVQPTPVIMLSSETAEGTEVTIQALQAGAIDFIQKPSGAISLDIHKVSSNLLEKLKIAVNSRQNIAMPPAVSISPKPPIFPKKSGDRFHQLVAIGTSTGGPRALQHVLSEVPQGFPSPIVIVQHMPPKFTLSLAQRLDSICSIHVKEAEHEEMLKPGTAYIAPGGYHMKVKRKGTDYQITLSQEEPMMGHRPSVDRLFESIATLHELKKYVLLLTGMGSDGARGMQAIKSEGSAVTFAESKETCVVYGMPRSAVELGVVDHVLPLQRVMSKMLEVFQAVDS